MGSVLKWLNFSMKELYAIKTRKRKMCESNRRLDGQVVVITGANTGIGKETARELALRGATVYIGCRNLEKTYKAINDIKESNPKAEVKALALDLASLKSVRNFAKELTERVDVIDILINNAGVMMCPEWQTEDGFEMQFGTNHLGHFLLTLHLLPLIKRSPKARVITLSSSGHLAGKIHFDNINLRDGAYTKMKAYAQSKLANLLFTRELAKRLGQHSHITTYTLHPGPVRTELQRHMNSSDKMMKYLFVEPVVGAQTTLYCALDEELDNETGHYYNDCTKVEKMIKPVTDDNAHKLWELSCELVSLEDHLKI